MGKKKKASLKVVLDTNILVSALLFRGKVSKIVELWKKGQIEPWLSRETFHKLREVLNYPKFSLTVEEIRLILEDEVIPFFCVTEETERVIGICRDAGDDKFLTCAVSASANHLVSGVKDLYEMRRYKSVKIIKVSDFLKLFR